MSEHWEPCPFCGTEFDDNEDVEVVHYSDDPIRWNECDVCGATGPRGEDEEEATELWNARSDPFGLKGVIDAGELAKELEQEVAAREAAERVAIRQSAAAEKRLEAIEIVQEDRDAWREIASAGADLVKEWRSNADRLLLLLRLRDQKIKALEAENAALHRGMENWQYWQGEAEVARKCGAAGWLLLIGVTAIHVALHMFFRS